MYSWRVKALRSWMGEFKADGERQLMVSDLESLGHLDQYHYRGLAACDEVIATLGLGPGMKVLDVGCGVGGPARYISYKSGCSVVGYDVQEELIEVGKEITEAVGLSNKVDLVCGDAAKDMYASENREKFDSAFSLLVILHIPDRIAVLKAMYEALKPGGSVLIEDMVHLTKEGPFTTKEGQLLRDMVGAHKVSDVERRDLLEAGFVDIEFRDLTSIWRPWSQQRSDDYEASKERQISSIGEEHYCNRSKFYAAVAELFRGGRLGGVSITMRKPTVMERNLIKGRAALAEERILEGKGGRWMEIKLATSWALFD
ncbi:3-demethylubiquinone-9 3-methyltransferase, putative [Perkinsus marinus ATCC 50983]|uniref:phosphoethanolamine N-methyltransferase n=1 Tax=Perkinsus marinus (strain ATCC 50983 / TXsc) TaxID=423536 RepID=C5L2J5_PERM5|nr:3-demethylubiquinone-9 3-methyltransferase, putative [Perkinsus marinus ATCC 50983]EER09089.1 3-demethylubiquinone-9 3-methyltransferase, putative [Perkinsus marinus ATCC 50983]|eukprot:XP_002777273.1 3-demethylubiquinone-9 3-methyltransferase, putative [Perkinsus marinus ATCC 50983]